VVPLKSGVPPLPGIFNWNSPNAKCSSTITQSVAMLNMVVAPSKKAVKDKESIITSQLYIYDNKIEYFLASIKPTHLVSCNAFFLASHSL
jgi:hypothetical protein